jgi:hypothetical protein
MKMKMMPMKKVIPPYRYTYINVAYRKHGAEHGFLCDPVRREDGRCVVGGGKQVVVFEDGTEAVVIRRCLRLVNKQDREGRR